MAGEANLRRIFARNVRAALAARKKSVVALAGLASVSVGHLYDVIRCDKSATLDFVLKLAEALEVEPWQLLRPSAEIVEEKTRREQIRPRPGPVRKLNKRRR